MIDVDYLTILDTFNLDIFRINVPCHTASIFDKVGKSFFLKHFITHRAVDSALY